MVGTFCSICTVTGYPHFQSRNEQNSLCELKLAQEYYLRCWDRSDFDVLIAAWKKNWLKLVKKNCCFIIS